MAPGIASIAALGYNASLFVPSVTLNPDGEIVKNEKILGSSKTQKKQIASRVLLTLTINSQLLMGSGNAKGNILPKLNLFYSKSARLS